MIIVCIFLSLLIIRCSIVVILLFSPQILCSSTLYFSNYLFCIVKHLIQSYICIQFYRITTQQTMNTQPQPIEAFSQQDADPQNPRILRDYNIKIIKSYLKKSYLTITAFLLMLLMFLISTAMTYAQNSQSPTKYSVTSLSPRVLIKLGANVGFAIKYGQIYRAITPIFLHAGIQHFLVNSFSMFGLLMNVQKKFNKLIFLMAFLIGGLQGNLLSLFANFMNENDNIVSVGASTSICAILGLYLGSLYLTSLKNGTVESVKKQIGFMTVYLLLVSVMPGVDFYGHLGSFIGGSLIGLSFSGLKSDYGEDSLGIKKLKIIALIIYANYSIFLLSIFLV